MVTSDREINSQAADPIIGDTAKFYLNSLSLLLDDLRECTKEFSRVMIEKRARSKEALVSPKIHNVKIAGVPPKRISKRDRKIRSRRNVENNSALSTAVADENLCSENSECKYEMILTESESTSFSSNSILSATNTQYEEETQMMLNDNNSEFDVVPHDLSPMAAEVTVSDPTSSTNELLESFRYRSSITRRLCLDYSDDILSDIDKLYCISSLENGYDSPWNFHNNEVTPYYYYSPNVVQLLKTEGAFSNGLTIWQFLVDCFDHYNTAELEENLDDPLHRP
jgi:hypothetical protein